MKTGTTGVPVFDSVRNNYSAALPALSAGAQAALPPALSALALLAPGQPVSISAPKATTATAMAKFFIIISCKFSQSKEHVLNFKRSIHCAKQQVALSALSQIP
jgi:hypothetical protein